jgi:hypothetical protein
MCHQNVRAKVVMVRGSSYELRLEQTRKRAEQALEGTKRLLELTEMNLRKSRAILSSTYDSVREPASDKKPKRGSNWQR